MTTPTPLTEEQIEAVRARLSALPREHWKQGHYDCQDLLATIDARGWTRDAVIEECAEMANKVFAAPGWNPDFKLAALTISDNIRLLKS